MSAALNLGLTFAIIALDWATTAGVVVSFLLCLPIVLASLSDDPREIWLVSGISIAGFLAAAALGAPPIAPRAVWLPNRIAGFLALPAASAVAVALQRRRLEAVRAREEALAARDVAQYMTSILAHDLRAPLGLAVETLELLREETAENDPSQASLLTEVEARLKIGLAVADATLALARDQLAEGGDAASLVPIAEVDIAQLVHDETARFAEQARLNRKQIVVRLDAFEERRMRIAATVLRQVLRILIDNAIRYARPGNVRIQLSNGPDGLVVQVADAGPATVRPAGTATGAGLGLDLCRVLLQRVGGGLHLVVDDQDGTCFEIRLPTGKVPATR